MAAACQRRTGFKLAFPDGSQRLYKQGNSTTPTKYYLSQVVDPQGNSATLEYDAQLRLSVIFDALERPTTISYEPEAGDQIPGDTLKIRKVTDPFSRAARLKYTALGQLEKIIDPVGIISEFRYAASDFIDRLITPYGATTFAFGELAGINAEPGRFVEATDMYGDKERVEANDLTNFPQTESNPAPDSVVVAGQTVPFLPKNDNLSYRNTYHWDKEQWHNYAGDYSKATVYNWLATNDVITGTLASIKKPLEGRVWYNYPGQVAPHAPGNIGNPSKTVRAIEKADGTGFEWSMEQQFFTNDAGQVNPYAKVTGSKDALGRELKYEYAANGRDLLFVKAKDGAAWRTLLSLASYTNHQPRTITDAGGTVTTLLYNGKGQIERQTTAKAGQSETTRWTFDRNLDGTPDPDGYVIKVERTAPNNPAGFVTLAEYTYDAARRVRTSKDAEAYLLTFDYDNLDRTTLVTHPDATTDQNVYERLDLSASKNRAGEWRRFWHNGLRQLGFEQDARGRVTSYEWCRCGDLRKLTDPRAQVTWWKRDAQGRVYEKVYPDNSKTTYGFQPLSGRLDTLTAPNDQGSSLPTVTYRYFLDGQAASKNYSAATTGNVSYAYNDFLGRLTAMNDSVGASAMTYVPLEDGTNGAGRLYEMNGPWANDTIRYGYDWQNRPAQREIRADAGTVLSTQTVQFDSLGRTKQSVNNLGTFAHQYNATNLTPKVDSIAGPNGLTASFGYYPINAGPNAAKLQTIHHQRGGVTLSKFDYTYDPADRIKMWKQQQGTDVSAARTWDLSYSRAGELTEAVLKNSTGAILSSQGWNIDGGGNWYGQSLDNATTHRTHNNLNQLTKVGGAGRTLVEGVLDEPGSVKVNNEAAQVTSIPAAGGFLFQREVALSEGANTITIAATDGSNNTRTRSYTLQVGGTEKTFEYDLTDC